MAITPVGISSSSHTDLFNKEKILEEWFKAADQGDLNALKIILKYKSDVVGINTQTKPGGYSALHLAVEKARVETVEWLLEQGADIWLRTDRNELPKNCLDTARCIVTTHDDEIQKIEVLLEQKESNTPEPEREQIEEIIKKLWSLASKQTPFTSEDTVSLKEVLKQTHALKYQNVAQRLNLISNNRFSQKFLYETIYYEHPELLEELMRIPNTNPAGGQENNTLVSACAVGAAKCLKLLLDSEKVDPTSYEHFSYIALDVYPFQACLYNILQGARDGSLRDKDIETARVFINHPRVPVSVFRRNVNNASAFDTLTQWVYGFKVTPQNIWSDSDLKGIMNDCLDKLEQYRTSPECAIVRKLNELAAKKMDSGDIEGAKKLIQQLQELQPKKAWLLLEPDAGCKMAGGDIRFVAETFKNFDLIEMLNSLRNQM